MCEGVCVCVCGIGGKSATHKMIMCGNSQDGGLVHHDVTGGSRAGDGLES